MISFLVVCASSDAHRVADFSLVFSFPALFYHIHKHGVDNVSFETQVLQFITFLLRYWDIFYFEQTNYNGVYKTLYLFWAYATIMILFGQRRRCQTLDGVKPTPFQTRRVLPLLAPCLLLGFVNNYGPTMSLNDFFRESSRRFVFLSETAWAMSIYLHVVAFIPQFQQLVIAARTTRIETTMMVYLVSVFLFRALYLPHWFIRYLDQGMLDPLALSAGVVQTVVFMVGGLLIVTNNRRALPGSDSELGTPLLDEGETLSKGSIDIALSEKTPVVPEDSPRTPSLTDALAYLDQVKAELNNPVEYNKFLILMQKFRSGNLDTSGMIDEIIVLFNSHPSLILAFNTFLPSGYYIVLAVGGLHVVVNTPQGTSTFAIGAALITGDHQCQCAACV
ncbi:hypothetical protein PUNSTDRAFT_133964 [Punctularia strigosozonata HHB-11173 SS5]|uniref:uncharacterized protein n=1 Tax=Punctularia strigosozonata (strain HHB-11173) TaxID=741275 RepID=UPI0004417BD1|nr:uncharacterized protein PUNSTDRAFT_133964 [Punctularia strigosozonata HHB-11173 SS5]EIN08783.1 hypothetical protein PUNSTDRAFT_133964 [Punctularia strigosozonata HHB-11173 SS5]